MELSLIERFSNWFMRDEYNGKKDQTGTDVVVHVRGILGTRNR
jgi:hypothetical protein